MDYKNNFDHLLMRKIVLLFLFACLAVTQVQADYFYKLRLNTITGGDGMDYNSGWTSWILVQSGDGRQYSLENLYKTVDGGSSFTVMDDSNRTYNIKSLSQITGFAAKGRNDNKILDGDDRTILVENLHSSIMVLDLKDWGGNYPERQLLLCQYEQCQEAYPTRPRHSHWR